MEAPGFWDDPERSNQKMKELKNLKDTVGECDKLSTQYDDILTLIDMGYEENDESLIPEIRGELDEFIREFDELRIGTLLSGEYDKNNAILKLNAGAGGRGISGGQCSVDGSVSYLKVGIVRHRCAIYDDCRSKAVHGIGADLSDRGFGGRCHGRIGCQLSRKEFHHIAK